MRSCERSKWAVADCGRTRARSARILRSAPQAEPWSSLRRGRADRFAVACTGQSGADELAEQRRRPRRPRLELRMELAGDEPGMVRQLDHLDQAARLERARDHEPR